MSIITEDVELARDCEAIQIPAGHKVVLVKGTKATITQALGGSYTLHVPSFGGLFQISGQDADAIGKKQALSGTPGTVQVEEQVDPVTLEKRVWEQLKTCFDPEIPVNIVDLGLIYGMQISPLSDGGYRVDVKMTLTAQGCGMGRFIAADAQAKLLRLPGVGQAHVEVVWDPPWTRDRISPEGKARLGIR